MLLCASCIIEIHFGRKGNHLIFLYICHFCCSSAHYMKCWMSSTFKSYSLYSKGFSKRIPHFNNNNNKFSAFTTSTKSNMIVSLSFFFVCCCVLTCCFTHGFNKCSSVESPEWNEILSRYVSPYMYPIVFIISVANWRENIICPQTWKNHTKSKKKLPKHI